MSSGDELKDKGVELYKQYDYEAAAKTFEQAREAYAQAGQTDMVAEMLVNIGLVHRALDECLCGGFIIVLLIKLDAL
ncbi:MAG: hypothetical protein AAFR22_18185, partial [Chloroflexota bacterium]